MPVLGGESLDYGDRRQIDAALAVAKHFSDLDFEAYVGPAGNDPHAHAVMLHSHLPRPQERVLVLCDPSARALEIVTGQDIRQYLDDAACRLAVATMTSSFIAGDLVGGLVRGIQQLGEAAYHPETLHAEPLP